MDTVSILSCNEYDYPLVKKTLLQSIENIGGLSPYIKPGERVLLKVNLLMKKTPEEATTTHPVFVQAMADILHEYGASVLIGDSPGGPFSELLLKGQYKAAGLMEAAEKSGATLNYNTNQMQVANPKGKYLKKLIVTEMLRDVDKVISLSKLKTHGMARMTGAVKNLFGTIPGALKAEYHLNMPDGNDFANALIDICLYANPVLSFMDGIIGMEGNGPSSGTPRKIGAVLASSSPFALDMAAAKIIHVGPESVPTLKNSIQRGLCPSSLSEITLVGDPIGQFIITDFKAPQVTNINPYKGKIPRFMEAFVNHNLQPRPVFLHDSCIGCGDCDKNCPPNAIKMENHRPSVDLDKCIRCFCCQELCPKHAIKIKRPILFRLASKV